MKIKYYLSIGLVGCKREEEFTLEECGLTQKQWDDMNEKQRDFYLEDIGKEWADDQYEWGWIIE